MSFHYALTLERAHILPLDSEEVGKGDAEASFFLSSGEWAGKPTGAAGAGRYVRSRREAGWRAAEHRLPQSRVSARPRRML